MFFIFIFLGLSYCQVNKVIAVLYACYTDSIQVDSATMRCFLPLIQSTPIKDIVEVIK